MSESIKKSKRLNPIFYTRILLLTFLLLLSFVSCSLLPDESDNPKQNNDTSPSDGIGEIELPTAFGSSSRSFNVENTFYSERGESVCVSSSEVDLVGYKLPLPAPTEQDTEHLNTYQQQPDDPLYKREYLHANNDNGSMYIKEIHFEKHSNGTIDWRVIFTDCHPNGHVLLSDGLIVYGDDLNEYRNPTEQNCIWITKITNDGNIEWKLRIDSLNYFEFVKKIIVEPDGSLTVFTSHIRFIKISSKGEIITSKAIGIVGDGNFIASHFSDGYILKADGVNRNDHNKIIILDAEGTPLSSFCFPITDTLYTISDIIEYNGKLYLSISAMDVFYDKSGGMNTKLFDFIISNYNFRVNASDNAYALSIRDFYTAMLVEVDASTGKPTNFYWTQGALGSSLSINPDNTLSWCVESIETINQRFASSFMISGKCRVYEYTFSSEFAPLSLHRTKKVTLYKY